MMRTLTLLCVLVGGCGSDRPYFHSVAAPVDTYDTHGPYRLEAYVGVPRGVRTMQVCFVEEGSVELAGASVPMIRQGRPGSDGVQLRVADLPGQSAGTTLVFYLALIDSQGRQALYPKKARRKSSYLRFSVLPEPGGP